MNCISCNQNIGTKAFTNSDDVVAALALKRTEMFVHNYIDQNCIFDAQPSVL